MKNMPISATLLRGTTDAVRLMHCCSSQGVSGFNHHPELMTKCVLPPVAAGNSQPKRPASQFEFRSAIASLANAALAAYSVRRPAFFVEMYSSAVARRNLFGSAMTVAELPSISARSVGRQFIMKSRAWRITAPYRWERLPIRPFQRRRSQYMNRVNMDG